MMEQVKNTMYVIKSYFDSEPKSIIEEKSKSYLDLVEEAKKEWLAAKDYFENVSEPELIDYAIHSMEATEKRYNFLLKKLKQMNPDELK